MTASFRHSTSDNVVGKVLRRAEVAKMARKLQDRLALASYKTQHGQEGLSFDDVEAHLETFIQRKRPCSSLGTSSNSSPIAPEHQTFPGDLASSPLTAPFFSDGISSSGVKGLFSRNIRHSTPDDRRMKPSKRIRSHSMAPPSFESSRASWESSHNLSKSSPTHQHHQQVQLPSAHGPNLSFASEVSTIPASPPFGHVSDGEDTDLPHPSISTISAFRGSLPCTPPPTRNRSVRHSKAAGEEGADLLLYLATSPPPANPGIRSSHILAPSTPPSKAQALQSAMMNTPGLTGFNTPGQNFNFADFVNVTPSPAQGAFGSRTPGPAKTPLATQETRRRLNFETLVPPSGSPNLSNVRRGSMNKDSGLGMELGGELVSS